MCLDKSALMQALRTARCACRAPSLLDTRRPRSTSWARSASRSSSSRGAARAAAASQIIGSVRRARRHPLRRDPHRAGVAARRGVLDRRARPPGGGVVAAVPRRRDKVDSGIAVAGRTVADPALERVRPRGRRGDRRAAAWSTCRPSSTADGGPALLEVNARFPGTMALTQAAGRRHAAAGGARGARRPAARPPRTSARSPWCGTGRTSSSRSRSTRAIRGRASRDAAAARDDEPRPVGVDLDTDLHTHSDADRRRRHARGDGRRRGCRPGCAPGGCRTTCAPTATGCPTTSRRVRGLRRDGLQIRCGVEAKILDRAGRLDLPAGPACAGLRARRRPPVPRRRRAACTRARSRAELEAGAVGRPTSSMSSSTATCAALSAQRRSPPIVVHPFSLLPKMGLCEDDVTDEHLDALAAACRAAGAAVEINEKWRCPSAARASPALAGRGVRLVAGSDAHRGGDVGAHALRSDAARATLLETALLETVPVDAHRPGRRRECSLDAAAARPVDAEHPGAARGGAERGHGHAGGARVAAPLPRPLRRRPGRRSPNCPASRCSSRPGTRRRCCGSASTG